MLAQRVLVAFPVFVQDIAPGIDAHGRQGEGGHQFRRLALQVGLVQGRVSGEAVKAGTYEVGVLPGKVDGAVGGDCQGSLVAGEGGEACGYAALFPADIQVLTAFPPAGEHKLLAVCCPERVGFIGPVGSDLAGLTTGCGDGENVSFIAECQGFAIRGDGVAANPSGGFLGLGCNGERKAGKGGKNNFFHNKQR